MSVTSGFAPGASATIAVTATTGSVALAGQGDTVYIANVGTKEAFIVFGVSTVTATAQGAITGTGGGTSIPSGLAVAFNIGPNNTHVAAICGGSDTTTLRFTRGDGQ